MKPFARTPSSLHQQFLLFLSHWAPTESHVYLGEHSSYSSLTDGTELSEEAALPPRILSTRPATSQYNSGKASWIQHWAPL